jgi:uncharacterized membrane protein (DUF485 family)
MGSPDWPVLKALRAELGRLSADVQEMVALRWQLASLELRTALEQLKGLAIALAVAAVMGLTALPLVAVAAAELLDGRLGLSRHVWLLLMALGLLVFAFLVATLAWRRFRRRFVGLQETMEEVREDGVWLRDWWEKERANVEKPMTKE